MNKGFVFYDSFFESLKDLTGDQVKECLFALAEYGLKGTIPEGLSPLAKMYVGMAKPQIDANNERRENGRKGGRTNKKSGVEESEEATRSNPKQHEATRSNVKQPEAKEKDKDKDKVKDNQKKELTLQKKAAADSVSEAVDLWNSMNVSEIDEHVEVKKGSKRFRTLSNLLAVHGIDKYREAIAKVKQSEFLRGHGDRGWVIKFNWMIQPENFGNILSGAYDRCSAPNSKPVGNKFNNCMQREHSADYFTELEKAKLGSLGIVCASGVPV